MLVLFKYELAIGCADISCGLRGRQSRRGSVGVGADGKMLPILISTPGRMPCGNCPGGITPGSAMPCWYGPRSAPCVPSAGPAAAVAAGCWGMPMPAVGCMAAGCAAAAGVMGGCPGRQHATGRRIGDPHQSLRDAIARIGLLRVEPVVSVSSLRRPSRCLLDVTGQMMAKSLIKFVGLPIVVGQ